MKRHWSRASRETAPCRPVEPGCRRAVLWLVIAACTGATFDPGPVELVALAPGNVLLRFDSADPGAVRRIELTGIQGSMLGIDLRPANGKLYGVTDTYDLYAIDPGSGRATRVSTLTAPFDGGPHSGVDFNPQSDRLRLIGANGQNMRIHVDLGAAATDAALAYRPKDRNMGRRPHIVAAAYTRSVPHAPATQLFDIDAAADALVLQDPPNDGLLRTVGPLGVAFGPESGFDILAGPGETDIGFAATGSNLYRVDLKTGAATRIGTIGDGKHRVLGLAVLPAPGGGARETARPRAAY
jgi:uncharacterized protein DUF4394